MQYLYFNNYSPRDPVPSRGYVYPLTTLSKTVYINIAEYTKLKLYYKIGWYSALISAFFFMLQIISALKKKFKAKVPAVL